MVIILVNVTHPLPNSYRGGTLTLFELLHVSFLGEAEFWMSCVKLLVMTTLILTCFVISMDGQPSGKRIGFSYWNDPGAYLLGFWAAIVQSTFAYTGTEVVGVAFGEAPNLKRQFDQPSVKLSGALYSSTSLEP